MIGMLSKTRASSRQCQGSERGERERGTAFARTFGVNVGRNAKDGPRRRAEGAGFGAVPSDKMNDKQQMAITQFDRDYILVSPS